MCLTLTRVDETLGQFRSPLPSYANKDETISYSYRGLPTRRALDSSKAPVFLVASTTSRSAGSKHEPLEPRFLAANKTHFADLPPYKTTGRNRTPDI